jgi:imidazole glycerol-phosphate synthase subunit HisH
VNSVTIIDYGVGNLYSVTRSLELCGAEVHVSSSPADIDRAVRLVLPGVGAFADGMDGLHQRGLVGALRRYAETDRPLLGICLGMQMLLEYSYEFGVHEGLGIIQGNVVGVPPNAANGDQHKIPHIGWSRLRLSRGRASWTGTPLGALREGDAAYFVHSFMAAPSNAAHRLADCEYDGVEVSAAIARGLVTGCQFHPEKSGETGLRVLKEFLR